MKRLLGVALAALSIHASSHADVMYQWTSVANATPADVSMTMVFSDDALAQGQLSYHLGPMQSSTVPLPLPGLEYFAFGVKGITSMSYTPASELFRYGLGILDMELQFSPDGYLTGSIYANDANSDVRMSSVGELFTISAMHSDQSMDGRGIACDGDPSCTWSSGVLARGSMADAASASDSAAVPEPGSLALIGLGLLGVGGLSRRRLAGARDALRS